MTEPRIERIGDAVLYLGDCYTILPTLPPVDAVVTDPPYGTGWIVGGGKNAGDFKADAKREAWDEWDAAWLSLAKASAYAVFCPDGRVGSLQQAAGMPTRLRYYLKSNPRPPLGGNDSPSIEPVVIWPKVRNSTGTAHLVAYNGDAVHPCQKPISIMEWLVSGVSDPGQTVLDPFLGSGSTGVACANLGRKFIGIEALPEYFDIACERIAAAYAQGRLFA
jgi:site-specific DNA-methyltransferase (adenine-specific)